MKNVKHTAIAAGVIAAFSSAMAEALHFRGAATIPTGDANGKLTVTITSF